MTGTGPRPGAGAGLRTGLGQSCAPRGPGAQVDALDKEEDAVHVISSAELHSSLLWADSYDRKGDTQPRMHFFPLWGQVCKCQRRSCTVHSSRESRHDPESGGGMIPVGFKSAEDLSLVCGHQVSCPKDVPGSGRNRLPPVSGPCWIPLPLLWSLKQRFFPKPGS